MPSSNLGQAILDIARAHGDRPALWCRGEQLTYRAFLARAGSLAETIRTERLAAPGDRVAILAERTSTLYVGVFAALLAGCAYVPLNPRWPASRNRSVLARSGARVLIADERRRLELPTFLDDATPLPAVLLPESDEAAPHPARQFSRGALRAAGERLPCEDAAGDLAYVVFTSGSTGEPKGVPIRHDSVFAYLRGVGTIFTPTVEDRILQIADVSFDMSVHDLFLAWTSGACLYSVPENAALLCTRFVEEHQVTAWMSVPSTAGLIRQSGLLTPGGMPSLRHSFFCGEALTGTVAAAFGHAAPQSAVHNVYGPTEATVAISGYRCDPATVGEMAVVPLGEVFPEQHMRLFDNDGAPSTDGDVGEICLAGSQVTAGYWGDPALTADRFFEAAGQRWYRTGDLGRYDAANGFAYAGRTDHQVKIRGFRVELQEIETVVRRAAERDLAAVVPWPLTADGGALGCVAFVTGTIEAEPAMIARCAEKLPDYMVPSRIIAIEQFPFNANGKVDYVALRDHPLLTI